MLTLPPHVEHLGVLKSKYLSAGWYPKSSTAILNGRPQLVSFQNPQILRTISSGNDVSPISCPGVYYGRWWLSYPGCKTSPGLKKKKITHEPITRIISKQLDIKLGPFTQEELDSVLRKIKNRKAAGLDEIPPEVWKTKQFDDILLRHCNAVYNQNPIDKWMKGCILPFPKKGDLGLAKNYRGITLTSIAAKIYNALIRNRIEPKIDIILRKNQNGFRRNRSTTSQILTIRRILEGVRAKKTTSDFDFCWLYQDIRFHLQRKDGTNPTSVRHT